MTVKDDLGVRMKTFYEQIPKTKLMRRCPVLVRLDGNNFHTFTRGFTRPFDEILIGTMQETTKYLCENIQGCVLGYTQSDEITLVLVDYKKFTSSAWFDYEVQKMCSIAASMATMAFNQIFQSEYSRTYMSLNTEKEKEDMCNKYGKNVLKLRYKSCNEMQDMLVNLKGINWKDLPTYQKRGSCVIKEYFWSDKNTKVKLSKEYSTVLDRVGGSDDAVKRSCWEIDKNIPIFKGEGREYIDKLIYVGGE